MSFLKPRKFETSHFEKIKFKKKQLSKKATRQRCFFCGYFFIAIFLAIF